MGEKLIDVTITLSEQKGRGLEKVVRELQLAGLTGSVPLESLGLVTGQCTASQVSVLRNVEGVLAVEFSGSAQLPDPDSGVQ